MGLGRSPSGEMSPSSRSERRRQQRLARKLGRRGASRRSRRPIGLLLLVLVVVIAAGAGIRQWRAGDPAESRASTGPGPQGRVGSVRLPGNTAIPPAPPPTSYDITYRIEESATDDIVTTTERAQVRRPFDSRVVTRRDGKVTTTRVSAFGLLLLGSGERAVLGVPPALATGDLRPDVVLPEVAESRTMQKREQRRVAGRRCQVYRAGKTALSGELVPIASAKEAEYADLCIDSEGLLLEEVWQAETGRRVRRKVATRVRTNVTLADSVFSLQGIERRSTEDGGGDIQPVDPERALPPGLWVLDSPPAGFTLQGKYAVLHPRIDLQQDPYNPQEGRTASFADVWVRGPDFVVLDRGEGAPFGPHPHAIKADLGALGEGETFVDLRSSEVRTTLSDGYVRLYGTLPRAELIALAKTLRRLP